MELTEAELALLPSKKTGGFPVQETAERYRANPNAEVEGVLADTSLSPDELQTWTEMRVLRGEIDNRLNEAITNPSDDRRLRLVNRIEEYFATCGGLSPKAAAIMKEEFKRQSAKP